ncbi:GTPase [Streptomyces sp. NPDC059371]|uniref:GTPase n=1 Tax=Streptomyces sp. NPDC059371 TaxID=3346812 RepID=UPI003688C063
MTAVTAVTDHTDQADRPGDGRPGDGGPGDGGPGDGGTGDGRPGGGRPEDGRPAEDRSGDGVGENATSREDAPSRAGASGTSGDEHPGRTDRDNRDARDARDSHDERERSTGATRSSQHNRQDDSAAGAAHSGARSLEGAGEAAGEAGRGDRAGGGGRTARGDGTTGQGASHDASGAEPHARGDGDDPTRAEDGPVWDDGLIARRVTEAAAARYQTPSAEAKAAVPAVPAPLAYDGPLHSRLDALRELVGLSRARLDSGTLAEAGRVLDEAAARRRLSGEHTVVAIAGATGSGKSQLFNALAGVAISETGVRRPTTSAPIACTWSDGAATLIDRLGIPGRLRRRPLQSAEAEAQLRGLVLVDLPDHDSAAVQHREQVDRVLRLVDAVIWVVDPEKYADAVLHERYLRPLAGHAEVTFVVLNQVDRLPGEAADQVLDDLRRLLDEDGVALGEYGEPGATVLSLSALTGAGVPELRECLGQFVAERGAAARRITADLDAAAARLRPIYATGRRVGLSEEARDEFADRLADAVGAVATGEAAERSWRRNANRACGTPWLRLWRWYLERREPPTGRLPVRAPADEEATARQRVEQAVRTVAERAAYGLPAPWAQAVREAAVRGAQGLPEALDDMAARATAPAGRPPRPGWWPVAVLAQAAMTIVQVIGGLWLVGQIIGVMSPNLGVPVLLMVSGIVGGPAVEWASRMAAGGPARRYGLEAERRLREAAAACGRARVLDPVAAELLRYREVREQYGRVIGTVAAGTATVGARLR